MNVDPLQLIQMIKSGRNPQQLMITLLEQNLNNNPMAQNLLTLAKQGRGNEIELIAKNIMKERGLDFNKEFSNFKNTLGIK